MDVDEAPKNAAVDAKAPEDGAAADKEMDVDKEKDKDKEPSSFTLSAPCRVVPHQVKHVTFPTGMHMCDI